MKPEIMLGIFMSELSMIERLAGLIRSKETEINQWLDSKYACYYPPIYTSVDIRNACHKIGVVDTNLFPSGFNNLCETFAEQASKEFHRYLSTHYPSAQKILLIPEDHTRNPHYFEHLGALTRILQKAGYTVVVGSSRATLPENYRVPLVNGDMLGIERVWLENGLGKLSLPGSGLLRTEGMIPDLILLNNDLSDGLPNYLVNLRQPVIPSPALGWHARRKNEHFHLVQILIGELAQILEIDPWLMHPLTDVETGIDLDDTICLKRLAEAANRMLMVLRQKHLEHKMATPPYLFIKNNSGTYGMAVTSVASGDEILRWRRRTKNKMQSAKGGRNVSEYVIQEGIATCDFFYGKGDSPKPFEPVVYLVGGHPIGIFFRIHQQRNAFESLNASGMEFTCCCFHKLATPSPDYQLSYQDKGDLFVITSLLGKVATLAVSLEEPAEWGSVSKSYSA